MTTLGGFDEGEFLAGFLAEAEEHLARAQKSLTALDSAARVGSAAPKPVRELFRAMHTLKGLSSMVGVEPVVEITHEMETLLRGADRSGGALGGATVQLLSTAVRALDVRLKQLAAGKPVTAAPRELLAALAHAPSATTQHGGAQVLLPEALAGKLGQSELAQLALGASRGERAVRVDFTPSPESAARGVNITSVRERLATVAELVKVLPLSRPVTADSPGGLSFAMVLLTRESDARLAEVSQLEASAFVALPSREAPASEPAVEEVEEPESRSYVRVEVSRLDDALERLGGLVVLRFRLARAAADLEARGVDVRELKAVLSEHSRSVRDLRSAVMRSRLVPVSEVLARVPLIVRGLAQSTGKPVRADVDGGSAELDKSVAERVFPALVHLLRNAVDHALEPAAERVAAGKPQEGLITVRCESRGSSQLELSVSDDGAGIDRERVAQRAGRPVPKTDAELLELITRPGLSTLDTATRTSGRGMGMDIVRKVAVEQLGGELLLSTERGKGTTFTLRIPLSITIIDALSFRCGGQTFVTPIGAVEDVVEVEPGAVTSSPSPPGADGSRGGAVRLLRRRGEALPLVSLPHLLNLTPAPQGLPKALIVRKSHQRCALLVDRMIGRQEVVVRPIGDPLVTVPGVSGSTDLGDGVPTLVLDLGAYAAPGRTRKELELT